MKLLLITVLSVFMFGSTAFSQHITDYHYNPGDNLHPFKLVSLVMRPPVALLNVFVKGGYYALDTEPTRRAFNIEYPSGIDLDSDY